MLDVNRDDTPTLDEIIDFFVEDTYDINTKRTSLNTIYDEFVKSEYYHSITSPAFKLKLKKLNPDLIFTQNNKNNYILNYIKVNDTVLINDKYHKTDNVNRFFKTNYQIIDITKYDVNIVYQLFKMYSSDNFWKIILSKNLFIKELRQRGFMIQKINNKLYVTNVSYK
jgi:hypothetical protein